MGRLPLLSTDTRDYFSEGLNWPSSSTTFYVFAVMSTAYSHNNHSRMLPRPICRATVHHMTQFTWSLLWYEPHLAILEVRSPQTHTKDTHTPMLPSHAHTEWRVPCTQISGTNLLQLICVAIVRASLAYWVRVNFPKCNRPNSVTPLSRAPSTLSIPRHPEVLV